MKKRFVTLLMVLILVVSCLPISAAAYSTDPNTNCTYIAWKMAVDRGFYVPENWGNAGSWFSSAQRAGYKTVGPDVVPPANSIACWGGGLNGWGHVAYVVSADNSVVNIGEGGRGYSATQPKYETFNYNFMRYGRYALDGYGNRYPQYLQGYICLGGNAPAAVSVTLDNPWATDVGEHNAVVHSVIRSGGGSVGCEKFGFQIWEKASGKLLYTHSEVLPASIRGYSENNVWLDLQKELGLTLNPGTEYTCQFSTAKGGKTFTSSKLVFKTAGTAPAPAVSPITLDRPWSDGITGNNAVVHSVIRNSGGAVNCEKFGFQIWEKTSGKLLYTHSEVLPASIRGYASNNIWLDLQKELGVTLNPGTEYICQFSTVKDGKTFTSEKLTFKTASSPITLDRPWSDGISRNNAVVHSVIRNSGASVYCSKFGFQIWEKASGKLLYTHSEAIPASIQHYSYINIWLDLRAELGLTLNPGTEYQYQFSTEKNGQVVKSSIETFKTAG